MQINNTPKAVKHLLYLCTLGFMLWILGSGCKKMVEIDAPRSAITSSKVFSNEKLATAEIIGIYSAMVNQGINLFTAITTFSGSLSSDEFDVFDPTSEYGQIRNNNISATNGIIGSNIWSPAYNIIFRANAAVEGLNQYSGIRDSVKHQLLGEAKFLRAYSYFYLINFFGDVPLVLTTNWNNTNLLKRTSYDQIYQQIIDDLVDAQNLLAKTPVFPNGERIRVNKYVVTALLARVYLYKKNWQEAETQATSIISNSTTFKLTDSTKDVFNKNNSEAIFQLQQNNTIVPYNATWEGLNLIPYPSYPLFISLTNNLINAFDTGDLRKKAWIDSSKDNNNNNFYYPRKYIIDRGQIRINNPVPQYYTLFRLAEQYLLRAEARAQQSKLPEAIADINVIRTRAGLPSLPNTLSQAQTMTAIEQENRIEFFAEWGHRWLDLKRWGRADAVLGPIKGSNWQTTDQLYPIPQRELITDPNLTQNPGY
jgi:starch-binding outer membrane protein, SusD/RagB family